MKKKSTHKDIALREDVEIAAVVKKPNKSRAMTTMNHIREGMFDLVSKKDAIEALVFMDHEVFAKDIAIRKISESCGVFALDILALCNPEGDL
jgi:hypothetical protein